MHKKKRIRLKHFTDKRLLHDKVLRSLNNIVMNDSVFMARELISNKVLLFIRTFGPALQKKANAYIRDSLQKPGKCIRAMAKILLMDLLNHLRIQKVMSEGVKL